MDRRLDVGSDAPVFVAVSGGGDSLSLLRLAKAWTSRSGRRLTALTVDHGLHPDSAAWTAAAGRTARRLGAEWRPLAWRGAKPVSGLPAAARTARHALLAEAVRAQGGAVLLLGHTGDDVAESAWMRAQTPTHGNLAEWAPSPAWPQGRDVFLLRPMLALRRTDLQAWLSRDGFDWLDDPANHDPRFARTRARTALAATACRETSIPQRPSRTALIEDDVQGCGFDGRADAWGALTIDRTWLAGAPGAVGRLARALVCVAGHARPPAQCALERLASRLQDGEASVVATLAGARLQAQGGRAQLTREAGRLGCQPIALQPFEPAVFDGRFVLTAKEAGWRAVALAGHAAGLSKWDRAALKAIPRAARPTLPVLLDADDRPALPNPFGGGPADARSLVGARFAASLGLILREGRG